MKYLVLILSSIFCASACSNNNCDITDYRNGKWIIIDTSKSYKLCSSSNQLITPEDSIQIEFLGILKEDQNVLIQTPEGLSLMTLFTGVPFGKYKRKQLDTIQSLLNILPALTKNSKCIVRFKLDISELSAYSEIVTTYFKPQVDSSDILKLNAKVAELTFIDSVIYESSDAAMNTFSKDVDSTWMTFLENNPLPSSSRIHIKKGFYNLSIKDSLTKLFSDESIISEISFPRNDSSILSKLSQSLKFPFFIKIKI